MKKVFTLFTSVISLSLLLYSSAALAQNGTCFSASPIACGDVIESSTIGIPNDNESSGAMSCGALPLGTGGQQWFVYTPENNETITFSLCDGTDFDSRIDVYTGYCGNLSCIGGNDDGDNCDLFESEFTLHATCGTIYYLRIGGYATESGNFTMNVFCEPEPSLAGCMNEAACNYSPCAIEDDGSCCYSGCVTLNMYDDWGDGWTGSVASIYSFDTEELIGTYTLEDGTFGSAFLCLDPGCYYIDVAAGMFADEVSWILTGVDGGSISGGAPASGIVFSFGGGNCTPGCMDPFAANYNENATVDDGSCIYCAQGETMLLFNMGDAFGDGWTGATYTITDSEGAVITTGDLDQATIGDGLSYGFDSFCLAAGCYFVTVTDGDFPGDITWSITNLQGEMILNGGPAGSAAPVENVGFAWNQEGCEILGCTNADCLNYNPNATEDDGSCQCPPENDQCAFAEVIECGSSVSGTTINSTFDSGLSSCQGLSVTSPGVWYTFTGNGGQVVISTCGSSPSGTFTDTRLHVWSGSCDNFTCVASNDDDPNCTYFKSTATFSTEEGVTYYVLVSEYSTGVGLDFVLDMTCSECANGTPPNDDCTNAIEVSHNVSVTGSLCCTNIDDISDCYSSTTGYGVWFTANSEDYDTFDFMITNGDSNEPDSNDGTNVGLAIYSSNGDCSSLEGIACCPLVSDFCGGSLFAAGIDITPNTQYYFLVYTSDPQNCGTFTLTTQFSYTGCTDEAADNYDPSANIENGSCQYSSQPDNNLCDNAQVISCNTTITGSTGFSSNTGAPNCPGVSNDNGVWYSFIGDGSVYTISTCGSPIDSRINVFSSTLGCSGPFTCIDDNDDSNQCDYFNADDASLTFASEVGVTYFVYVTAGSVDTNGDYFDDLFDGAFTLAIECTPPVTGCTDACACNYDPNANIDDDSCDYFSCVACDGGTVVMLTMNDAYGDGWNGGTYSLKDNSGAVIYTGSLNTAQCTIDENGITGPDQGFDMFCLADGCYTLVAGGGSWPSEISWSLADEFGNAIASGTGGLLAPFSVGEGTCGCTDELACNYDPAASNDDGSCEFISCLGCTDPSACNFNPQALIADPEQCCYENCLTLQMTDAFGDGWNGNTVVITDINSGEIMGSATLTTGASGQATFCLADGCYKLTAGGGSFASEISWTLVGGNGGPLTGSGSNLPNGITFSTGSSSCNAGCFEPFACNYDPNAGISDCSLCEYTSCQGCTYSQATNYNPSASIDDGSCQFNNLGTCPADIDGDGVVGVADLIIFIGAYGTVCN